MLHLSSHSITIVSVSLRTFFEAPAYASAHPHTIAELETINIYHSLRKRLRRFLGKIVPNAAGDRAVLVLARELRPIG
jgi:hypothetical protein